MSRMIMTSMILVVLAAGCSPSATSLSTSKKAGTAGPLESGWNCACAINNLPLDQSDRSLAQAKIAYAYLEAGDADNAYACGSQIEDWQKGMVLAKVAGWYIEHGQTAKAESMRPELQASVFLARDWQRPWLRVAISRVEALLGHEEEVYGTSSNLASHVNLAGDAAANLALALARTGRVDEAEAVLGNLGKNKNSDIAASRVQGYLDLVISGRIDAKTAPEVLTNAWVATSQVRPFRRWEVQLMVIDAMVKHGLTNQVGSHLEEVASNVVGAVKLPPEVRVSFLSQGALMWQRLNEPQKALAICNVAEQAMTNTLDVIFQPEAYSKLAECYIAIGDMPQARATYGRALDIAVGLLNRRPRANAGVEVCLSLAAHKEVIDADIQKRLERLVGTFDAKQP